MEPFPVSTQYQPRGYALYAQPLGLPLCKELSRIRIGFWGLGFGVSVSTWLHEGYDKALSPMHAGPEDLRRIELGIIS